MEWSHQLAAFKSLLEEALQLSREKPEKEILAKATALVTTEVQAGVSLHVSEASNLQDSYLGILQNALHQLQASICCQDLVGYPIGPRPCKLSSSLCKVAGKMGLGEKSL